MLRLRGLATGKNGDGAYYESSIAEKQLRAIKVENKTAGEEHLLPPAVWWNWYRVRS
jgi:hypothetical protein